jgi:hypothetical protein
MIHELRPYTYNKALAHPQQYTLNNGNHPLGKNGNGNSYYTLSAVPYFTIWLECLIVLQTMDTNFSFNYGRLNFSTASTLSYGCKGQNQDLVFRQVTSGMLNSIS